MIKKFNLDILESTSVDGINWEYRPNREDVLKKINEIIDVVNSMDEQEGEPIKHGRWINVKISISGNSSAECSLCGAVVHNNFSNVINYCPNCGARMDEVEE